MSSFISALPLYILSLASVINAPTSPDTSQVDQPPTHLLLHPRGNPSHRADEPAPERIPQHPEHSQTRLFHFQPTGIVHRCSATYVLDARPRYGQHIEKSRARDRVDGCIQDGGKQPRVPFPPDRARKSSGGTVYGEEEGGERPEGGTRTGAASGRRCEQDVQDPTGAEPVGEHVVARTDGCVCEDAGGDREREFGEDVRGEGGLECLSGYSDVRKFLYVFQCILAAIVKSASGGAGCTILSRYIHGFCGNDIAMASVRCGLCIFR